VAIIDGKPMPDDPRSMGVMPIFARDAQRLNGRIWRAP
jgi:hypothetical protein